MHERRIGVNVTLRTRNRYFTVLRAPLVLASSALVRRRAFAWTLVTPLAAVGALVTHALAYRLTGTSPGPVHEYLAHVPQVVVVLATIALVGLALQDRSLSRLSAWWVAPLAPLGFACQEHVERLVHTGELPFLLTSPTFLLGLALQLPVAVVCVALVRRVLGTLTDVRRRIVASLGEAWMPLSAARPFVPRAAHPPRPTGRGPPSLLGS
jgi:hypothetical protein